MNSFTVFLAIVLFSIGSAQNVFVEIDNLYSNDLKSKVFQLTSDQTVKVNVVGPRINRFSDVSHVWILDLETREPIWEVRDANADRLDRRMYEYKADIKKKKGVYQLFYSTHHIGYDINGFGDFVGRLFEGDWGDNRYRSRDLKEFKATIAGTGKLLNNSDLDAFKKNREDKIVIDLRKMGEDEYEELGFRVKSDVTVQVYAIGEIPDRDMADYAFIRDIDNNKNIWQLDYWDSEYAGGGEKNRFAKTNVTLKPGRYVLTFTSDRGHSYDNWNVIPPYDPENWGVTLSVLNASDKSKIERHDYRDEVEKNVIIALDRMGDHEDASKGFTLKKDMKVRILALGEGYNKNDLADYGWITDDKYKTVWDMRDAYLSHAGGSSKNRKADEVITLKKGSYFVNYVTDGSHSFRDGFNASRPHMPKKWGITLMAADDDFDKDDIADFRETENENVIARIVKVRDYERDSKPFHLDDDTDVRIYAIGEGTRDDMVDYGWIRNEDTGRTEWRMYYDETDHAGGARKNREVKKVIRLKAGNYKLYYKTDGSHSYGDWNASAPRDRRNYGITLYKN
ncbi:MAG: hypothetical protein KDD94_04050 [Calditrichaeota bacterium]|nr:hypothetical protein [Calditrichota bacterium]